MSWRGRIWAAVSGLILVGFLIMLVQGASVYAVGKSNTGPQKSDSEIEGGDSIWLQFGRDEGNTRSQPNETILNKTNIASAVEKWAYHSNAAIIKGPAIDENFIYFIDTPYFPFFGSSTVYKLNKAGQEIWKKDLPTVMGECGQDPNLSLQAVQTPALKGNKIIFGTAPTSSPAVGVFPTAPGGFVVTMNKNTGACETATLVSDPNHIDEGVAGSPTVFGNVAYMGISSNEEEATSYRSTCCSTIGKVVAVNINTGDPLWTTAMIDADPSTPAYDASANGVDVTGYSGVTVWSSAPVIYPEANEVIVTTGNAYSRGVTEANSLTLLQMPIDSIVALDMTTGVKRWVTSAIPDDYWNTACVPLFGPPGDQCPDGSGPDYDYAAGCTLVKNLPNNYGIDSDHKGRPDSKIDACMAINKEGSVHAVEVKTGTPLWQTKVGPETLVGLAGTCYDGKRIYATHVNAFDFGSNGPSSREWTLQGNGSNAGSKVYGGLISALDPASGGIIWQNADPLSFSPFGGGFFAPNPYLAPPTCVGSGNGFVLAASVVPNDFALFFGAGTPPVGPNMFAFDAMSGDLLESLPLNPNIPEAPVVSGATVVDGVIYWGDGLLDLPNPQNFSHRGGYLHSYALP